jgi:oxygen-independent coproporphyrinogen-3 oxidase
MSSEVETSLNLSTAGFLASARNDQQRLTDFMSNSANHNSGTVAPKAFGVPAAELHANAGDTLAATSPIRHLYVHIPFCARICPYCAFYKDLLDRSHTGRFCEAILRELELYQGAASSPSSPEVTAATEGGTAPRRTRDRRSLCPSTIYFGGGTPTALSIAQLELLLRGIREQLDLSQLIEWTMEANPGSVSTRKAGVLKKFGVNRISLGVQSWDDKLLKVLGREHSAKQAEQSFQLLRMAGFSNINVDLMFGLPGQTIEQWELTLEKTIALQPDHISAYCLTYEEDTEFFLRHARGEFRQDADRDAELFEMAMSILEDAGYEHYEISNYARPGISSVHNRAYWLGKDYVGIGPSAVSTVGMRRWQNICDYRTYIDRVLSGQSPRASTENLTDQMKRTERIALSLRTRDGVSASELKGFGKETNEFIALGLLRKSDANFALTQEGKALADSVAEAFL